MWAGCSFRCPADRTSIQPHPNSRMFWCQGQDSNLRSPSGQRFYRPSVLATHPPWPGAPACRSRQIGWLPWRLHQVKRAPPLLVTSWTGVGAREGNRTPNLPITNRLRCRCATRASAPASAKQKHAPELGAAPVSIGKRNRPRQSMTVDCLTRLSRYSYTRARTLNGGMVGRSNHRGQRIVRVRPQALYEARSAGWHPRRSTPAGALREAERPA
jgi:hypothetical protein